MIQVSAYRFPASRGECIDRQWHKVYASAWSQRVTLWWLLILKDFLSHLWCETGSMFETMLKAQGVPIGIVYLERSFWGWDWLIGGSLKSLRDGEMVSPFGSRFYSPWLGFWLWVNKFIILTTMIEDLFFTYYLCMCSEPTEARRGHWVLWSWSHDHCDPTSVLWEMAGAVCIFNILLIRSMIYHCGRQACLLLLSVFILTS